MTKKQPIKKKKVKAVVHGKAEVRGKSRGKIFCFDLPVTGVLRWMGLDKFSYAEAVQALKEQKVQPMPKSATVRTSLTRGEPAKLSAEQQKQLRDSAKAVKEEETK